MRRVTPRRMSSAYSWCWKNQTQDSTFGTNVNIGHRSWQASGPTSVKGLDLMSTMRTITEFNSVVNTGEIERERDDQFAF